MIRLKRWIPIALLVLAVGAAGILYLFRYGKEESLGFGHQKEKEGLTPGETDPAYSETRETGGEDIPVHTEDSTVCVHVCGSVRQEGIYFLSADLRVADAIEAAGGFREDADTSYWNLAERLTDGMKIYVPTLEETAEGTIPAEKLPADDGKVNINTAGLQQLMTLPGIGENRAGDIIAWREEHGGFKEISDIKKVSGIKDAVFEKIRDKIVVR